MGREPASSSSKRQQLRELYDTINQLARPGDVVFFISEKQQPDRSYLARLYRRWQGIPDGDGTVWHTALLVEPRKESNGARWRPHIVHATTKGVEEIHVPPSYFRTVRDDPDGEPLERARIEILQCADLTLRQRRQIVDFARAQLGKPFAELGWRHDFATYALGLPTRRMPAGKVSCHGMAFQAYGNVGFSFAHQLGDAPFFNLAHYLRRPLGHPKHEVDLDRLYLRDHHLYRDARFDNILAVFEDDATRQLTLLRRPGKHGVGPFAA